MAYDARYYEKGRKSRYSKHCTCGNSSAMVCYASVRELKREKLSKIKVTIQDRTALNCTVRMKM